MSLGTDVFNLCFHFVWIQWGTITSIEPPESTSQWGTITSVEPPDSLRSAKKALPTGPVFKHDLPQHLLSTNYHHREKSQRYVGERRFSQPKRTGIRRQSYFVNSPFEKKKPSLLSRRRRSSLMGIIIIWFVLLAIFAAIAVGLWLAGKNCRAISPIGITKYTMNCGKFLTF